MPEAASNMGPQALNPKLFKNGWPREPETAAALAVMQIVVGRPGESILKSLGTVRRW